MVFQEYKPKKILNVYKNVDGGWFWVKYSAHPYIGCAHACEYCYEWGSKYSGFKDPENFSKIIKVKLNAPELLSREIKKVPKELISVGDWQPAERKYHLSRKMLEVCLEEKFPVFICEKSGYVVRDLDLIKKINSESYVNVGFSIISAPNYSGFKQINFFESQAPTIDKRFQAMREFSNAGIMTGTFFMPILPFIFDNEENIEAVCRATKEAGGKYVLAGSLTLEGYQRDRYYNLLRKNFSDVLNKYISLYRGKYSPQISYLKEVMSLVDKYCQKYGLLTRIPRYIVPGKLSHNYRVAEYLYNKSRDFELEQSGEFKVYAYRKAAAVIDAMKYSVIDVYETMGVKGLEKIPNIGQKISKEIEEIIKKIAAKKLVTKDKK